MSIDRLESVGDQFSRVVKYGQTVYVAGLVSDNPEDPFDQQCRHVLATLDRLLKDAGTQRKNLLSVTVYLRSFDDYDRYRAEWALWVDQDSLPARATVRADLRDPRLLIEVQAIAALL